MEDAHLPEYVDPANTRRYSAPPGLRDLLLDGEFSAIMGERVVDATGIRTVIPNAAAAAHEWIAHTGIQPINHILAVNTALTDAYPWLPAELMTLFIKACLIAVGEGAEPPPPYGFEASRASLQCCLDYAAEQAITPHRYSAEEMFFTL